MPTAQKKGQQQKPVTFIATDNSLRLVRIPQRRRMNADTGESYVTDGHTVEFHEGRYATRDKDVIAFLREHDANGSNDKSDQPYGTLFVEMGKEPGRPLPEADDLLEQIVDAITEKDTDKLASVYLQERNTHSRETVLKAAARGLEKLEADVPAPDPVPEHQLERVRVQGSAPLPGGEDAKTVGKPAGSGSK